MCFEFAVFFNGEIVVHVNGAGAVDGERGGRCFVFVFKQDKQ